MKVFLERNADVNYGKEVRPRGDQDYIRALCGSSQSADEMHNQSSVYFEWNNIAVFPILGISRILLLSPN